MKRLLLLLLLVPASSFAQFELQSLYPTDGSMVSNFGRRVAISGSDMAVSCAGILSPSAAPGKVFLFNSESDTMQVLFPNDAEANDYFGATLAMHDNHLVVGAPYSGETGAVYIYTKIDGTWVQTQKLTFPIGSSGQRFGIQVVLNNDFLFVANLFNPVQALPVQGSIVAYHLENDSFTFFQQFGFDIMNETAQLATENDRLGVLVNVDTDGSPSGWRFRSYVQSPSNWTVEGDTNSLGDADNLPRALGIANGEGYILFSSLGLESRVATLSLNGTTWEQSNLTIVSGLSDHIFSSLVVTGDYMAVGSTEYLLQIERKFPVNVFHRTGNSWNLVQTLFGDGPADHDDYFGSILATDGEKIIIGAPLEGEVITTGRAYYFDTLLGLPSPGPSVVRVFPNPTDGPLSIEGPAVVRSTVFSLAGQKLLTSSSPTTLSVRDLASGVYLLQMEFADGTSHTERIIRK